MRGRDEGEPETLQPCTRTHAHTHSHIRMSSGWLSIQTMCGMLYADVRALSWLSALALLSGQQPHRETRAGRGDEAASWLEGKQATLGWRRRDGYTFVRLSGNE